MLLIENQKSSFEMEHARISPLLLIQTSIARDRVLYRLAQARFKFSAIIFN